MLNEHIKLDEEDKKHLQKHFDDILNGKIQDFVILGLNRENGDILNHQMGHKVIVDGLLHHAVRQNDAQNNENDKAKHSLESIASLFSDLNDDNED